MFFFHITSFNDSQSPWQQYHITKLIRTSIAKFHRFYIVPTLLGTYYYHKTTRKVFFMIDETGFEIKSYRTCSSRRISQMKYDFLGAHTSTYYTFVIILLLLLLLCRNAVKKYKNSDLFGIAAIINIVLIIIYK